jgi:hypothetical protein
MLDDRYIGLALAISSSFAIGTSIILTKKVRQPAGRPGACVVLFRRRTDAEDISSRD